MENVWKKWWIRETTTADTCNECSTSIFCTYTYWCWSWHNPHKCFFMIYELSYSIICLSVWLDFPYWLWDCIGIGHIIFPIDVKPIHAQNYFWIYYIYTLIGGRREVIYCVCADALKSQTLSHSLDKPPGNRMCQLKHIYTPSSYTRRYFFCRLFDAHKWNSAYFRTRRGDVWSASLKWRKTCAIRVQIVSGMSFLKFLACTPFDAMFRIEL